MSLPATSTIRALEARIDGLVKSRRAREAVIKSYVLNQYEMMVTCGGFTLTRDDLEHLTAKFFDDVVKTDPKTARPALLLLRRRLIAAYPFWIPNRLYLGIRLAHMPVAYREQARAALLDAIPFVKDMVIDSDHYAQLFIDCRHDPFSKTHPWIRGNARPWHIVERLASAMKKAWPKGDAPELNVPALISRLYLENLPS